MRLSRAKPHYPVRMVAKGRGLAVAVAMRADSVGGARRWRPRRPRRRGGTGRGQVDHRRQGRELRRLALRDRDLPQGPLPLQRRGDRADQGPHRGPLRRRVQPGQPRGRSPAAAVSATAPRARASRSSPRCRTPTTTRPRLHDIGVITLAGPTTAAAGRRCRPPRRPPPSALAGPVRSASPATGRATRSASASPRCSRTPSSRSAAIARCRRAYGKLFQPTAMICALGPKLKKYGRPFIHETACSGDSGGPLVADTPTGARADRHRLLRRLLLRPRRLADRLLPSLGLARLHPEPALGPRPSLLAPFLPAFFFLRLTTTRWVICTGCSEQKKR